MFPLRDTQPSYSKPVVTVLLIVINILVFLYEISLDPFARNDFIATYGLVPDHFSFLCVLTSMFLHGGWLHVLGNMRTTSPSRTRHSTPVMRCWRLRLRLSASRKMGVINISMRQIGRAHV